MTVTFTVSQILTSAGLSLPPEEQVTLSIVIQNETHFDVDQAYVVRSPAKSNRATERHSDEI